MFQACLVLNPSRMVCFENHAEWRFCLAPFWCVAPCRRSGARLAQWRPSALLFPSFVLALCTCALLLDVHLDSCDGTHSRLIQNSHIHCTIFNIQLTAKCKQATVYVKEWIYS